MQLLAETEWNALRSLATARHVKKGETFLETGARADMEIFIEHGAVHALLTDPEGNERTTAFFQAGDFITMAALRSRDGRSQQAYAALSATRLLLFDAHELKNALSATGELIRIGKALKEKETDRLRNRDLCLLQVTAKERYTAFRHQYPALEQLVAQRHIASYLGITPVSLSRAKRSLLF